MKNSSKKKIKEKEPLKKRTSQQIQTLRLKDYIYLQT